MNTIPSRLGPFALEERLGRTGQCHTYRAVHVARRVAVAIRLLPHNSVTGRAAQEAFLQEFEDLQLLRHSNCVRCLGSAVEGGWPYAVFAWVRGESLTDRLDRLDKLPWEAAVQIARGVCEGLACAHENGVLHGRIATDKVLLSELGGGAIQLVGFASARMEPYEGRTHRDLPPERAAFLAPEQWSDSTVITNQSDVYAVGCLLFQMLTGLAPHSAAALGESTDLSSGEPLRTVSSLEMTCPVWLDVLVERLLAPDPASRLASVREISDALSEAERHMASGVGTAQRALSRKGSALVRDDDPKELQRIRRRRVRRRNEGPVLERPWFLAVCLATLLGAAAWALWPLGEEALFERAAALMATGGVDAWRRARDDYLLPLQSRFPDSRHQEEVTRFLDQIEMEQALSKIKLNTRLGRRRSCDGERLFAKAWQFEVEGDQLSALSQYRALAKRFADSLPDANRPYVLLARRQVTEIVGRDAQSESAFIERHLDRADELAEKLGDLESAQRTWRLIIEMYESDQAFAPHVDQAKERLGDLP